MTSALYEVDSAYSPGIGQSLQERTTLRQKKRLTPAQKERLAELDKLADELTPGFDTESERALDVIRRAAALLDTPNT